MTFATACHKFFGKKPGQDLKEFGEELKALTEKDREDLILEFEKVGIKVD